MFPLDSLSFVPTIHRFTQKTKSGEGGREALMTGASRRKPSSLSTPKRQRASPRAMVKGVVRGIKPTSNVSFE